MSVIVGLDGKALNAAPRTKLALANDPLGLTPAPTYVAVGTFELNEEQMQPASSKICKIGQRDLRDSEMAYIK